MFDPKSIQKHAETIGKITDDIEDQLDDFESLDDIDMQFVEDTVRHLVRELKFAVQQVRL